MKNPSVLFWIIVINLWPACSSFLFSQQVLNGSFEVNTLDCGINLGNAEFNSHVMNISAFGGQSEIDLLSASCGYEIPPDGDFFIALYNNTFSDACSFELTSPLNAGKLYKFRFAARLGDGFSNQISKVEIGLSNLNDTFGTSVFFSPELESKWKHLNNPMRANYPELKPINIIQNHEKISFPLSLFHSSSHPGPFLLPGSGLCFQLPPRHP